MENTVVSDKSPLVEESTPKMIDNGENPLNRPLTIVFCLPGETFSHHFLKSWSELLLYCVTHKIRPILSNHQSCNIYYVRNMCLGGNVLNGIEQKPFNGQLDYDFIMWIDSDQVFSVNAFLSLLRHDKDVVSGLYLMKDGVNYTAVQDWDESHFLEKGSFKFLNRKSLMGWLDKNAEGNIEEKKDQQGNPFKDYSECKIPLMEVSYTGLGWTLVKKGVYEKMNYPWFYAKKISMNKSVSVGDDNSSTSIAQKMEVVEYTMEDVTFFLNLKEHGITPYVDVRSIVGHQKSIVL